MTGVIAYLIAVTQRTSFGVAGLKATERYSASASALSIFTVGCGVDGGSGQVMRARGSRLAANRPGTCGHNDHHS
ncbi:hypothetical protein [Arthrobacter zhaoguopingii]|uniref:hypothetical protein n=1 Tax=Arthrobacter zhaoguopingii TaxID=2681491 RepID=UPI001358DA13|nr:hypothetical protein [Arthrobacter zhaoguopingii]